MSVKENSGAEAPTESSDPETPATKAKAGDPVRKWTLGILALLGVLLILQVASDRTAPITSLATIEGLLVPVSAQVSGEIAEVGVRDNQVVEAGAHLFRLDPTAYRLAVETAEAQLAIAGQNIGASTAQVATAQARLAERRANLSNVRSQTERTLELVRRGVLAPARGEQAEADLKRAEADVTAMEADLRRAEAALGPEGSANPQLRAAVSALESARLNLAHTQVIAPVRGFVTNLRLGAGQYTAAGQPLITLVDIRGAWIVAWFRENQLGNLRIGDRVRIALDVRPGEVLSGRITGFGGGVTTPNQTAPAGGLVNMQNSGSWLSTPQRFPVRIEFDDAAIPEKIRIGSQATVMAHTSSAGWLSPVWALYIRAIALISYVY